MKNFFQYINATFRGAVLGQLIPVIAMPMISRLYAPDDYGLFASFISLSIVLMALITLQMDVAVVLPEDDETAGQVARTAFQISLITTTILTLVMIALQPVFARFGGLKDLHGWSILAPLMGFLMGMLLLANYIASRLRKYNEVGRSGAFMQLIFCTCAVIFGWLKPLPISLVLARLAGQTGAVACCASAVRWLRGHYRDYGILSWHGMGLILSRYRKFPLFTLPHTASSMLSRECVAIILIAFNQPQAAGFYALVRSILMIPASILSTTLGQIFYREASQSIDKPEFRIFSFELLLAIACIVAPGCIYLANWGPEIFAFVFGAEWKEAGIYAMVFMPVSMLFILSIWIGKVFEIRNRQDILFRIQLSFDALSIGSLIGCLWYGFSPVVSVGAYVALQSVYLLVYLGFVFRLLHLSAAKYVQLIGAALLAAAAQEVIHVGVGLVENGTWIHFGLESVVMAAVTITTGLFFWRLLKKSPVMTAEGI